jgi:hypothetical protein
MQMTQFFNDRESFFALNNVDEIPNENEQVYKTCKKEKHHNYTAALITKQNVNLQRVSRMKQHNCRD